MNPKSSLSAITGPLPLPGCEGRLATRVLDWITPAIDFYRSLGAQAMDEWTVHRITGTDLEHLARRTDQG